MAIVIRANPGRIEEVSFTGLSIGERAVEAATYSAIALLVDRIDEKLRDLCDDVVDELEHTENEREAAR